MSREGLKKALLNWQDKLAAYEHEFSITSHVATKLEMRKRIEECEQEIERLKKRINSIEPENQIVTGASSPKIKSEIQIFLAHASEDKPQVRELYFKLKEEGYTPWLDEEDLIAGQNWREEIPKAIKKSKFLIACLSSKSVNKRGYIQRELKIALDVMTEMPSEEIFVIPLRLEECDVPDLRVSEGGLTLRDLHWVDYWKEDSFKKLVKAIEYQCSKSTLTSFLSKPEPESKSTIELTPTYEPNSIKLNIRRPEQEEQQEQQEYEQTSEDVIEQESSSSQEPSNELSKVENFLGREDEDSATIEVTPPAPKPKPQPESKPLETVEVNPSKIETLPDCNQEEAKAALKLWLETEQELIALYNNNSDSLPSNLITEVSATVPSMMELRSGKNAGSILEQVSPGAYLVVKRQDTLYLVPNPHRKLSRFVMDSIQANFNCHNYQGGTPTQNFQLIKPARVSVFTDNHYWQLVGKGELRFLDS